MDLTNLYRASINMPKLVWSDSLQSLCFDHANAMAKGTQSIALYNAAELLAQVKLKVEGATAAATVAENIAVSVVTPTSNTVNTDAVNDAFKQWKDNTDARNKITGTYTHTAIAVVEGADKKVYFT